jgi:protocatechuate 3,4-dioxygenase beta subunit
VLGGTQEAEAASCLLSPEVTEGPYWIRTSPTRRDIRERKGGLQLDLVFTVQNARTCTPISGADVEIWHADAAGVYFGFEQASTGGPDGSSGPTDATRYLRGHQRADADGRARFNDRLRGLVSRADPATASSARPADRAVVRLASRGAGKKGYRGSITLGVATS